MLRAELPRRSTAASDSQLSHSLHRHRASAMALHAPPHGLTAGLALLASAYGQQAAWVASAMALHAPPHGLTAGLALLASSRGSLLLRFLSPGHELD